METESILTTHNPFKTTFQKKGLNQQVIDNEAQFTHFQKHRNKLQMSEKIKNYNLKHHY